MNYNLRVNLLKLKNALITECKGRTMTKKGIFIPIEDNDLYVSLDENLKAKSILLDLVAWELKEEGKYGDSHLIKQSFSREFRESITDEEYQSLPILGNMREMEVSKPTVTAAVETIPTDDDLLF